MAFYFCEVLTHFHNLLIMNMFLFMMLYFVAFWSFFWMICQFNSGSKLLHFVAFGAICPEQRKKIFPMLNGLYIRLRPHLLEKHVDCIWDIQALSFKLLNNEASPLITNVRKIVTFTN